MRKGTKALLRTLLVLGIALAAIAVWFKIRCDRMVKVFAETEVAAVDLYSVPDGVYTGTFGEFLVSATVEVDVEAHHITGITVVDQHCGSGYRALETIDRIMAAQSPLVDAVSGATDSSRCIMIAVYRALSAAAAD